METELSALEERIANADTCAPSDDFTDPAVVHAFLYLFVSLTRFYIVAESRLLALSWCV
jgi:F0F1-type ATP synthase beta subunit